MSDSIESPTVFDVAKYVFKSLGVPYISQIKLYKLLWFCQGWHYNITQGEPLFHETFEAWEHGPVPRVLWNYFRGKFQLTESDFSSIGNTENIPRKSKSIIKQVLKHYGELTPSQLRGLSHQCDPWKNNYRKYDQSISNEEIRSYFCNLN